MTIKLKLPNGSYAIRCYDDDGEQIYYSSTRLGGIKCSDGEIIAEIPNNTSRYEIKNIDTLKIVSEGSPNVSDKRENLQAKGKIQP
ncbi:hypothetical protein [Ignavibacterium sp.]|uniref:hypothetical protein n=1 Tax=Ignavibacterium sp. TaxID=2651167 RepID=UPI00307F196E